LKSYRKFLVIFGCVFALYVIAELNRPTPINWEISLEKNDKNPYGGYVLYNSLTGIFPNATLNSYRTPIYNQLNNYSGSKSAYLVVSPKFEPSKVDLEEMNAFVRKGNYMFIAVSELSVQAQRHLRIKTATRVTLGLTDSTSVQLVNPTLATGERYIFRRSTIDEYFSRVDTSRTTVLGVNDAGKPNFIKITLGRGAYLVHAAPLCFSNYFMLFRNNVNYCSGALSYLPADTRQLFWDEYSKIGQMGPQTPLRFFLSNTYLSWALWLALATLIIYILVQAKRRQRIIPVIAPMRNSTLDFINTVSTVYLQQKDNNGIAAKKINHFFEFVPTRFYIPTDKIDDQFVQQLSRKSGVSLGELEPMIAVVREVDYGYKVNDSLLLNLNRQIDNFYNKVK